MLKLKVSYVLHEVVVVHHCWDEKSSENVDHCALLGNNHTLNYKCLQDQGVHSAEATFQQASLLARTSSVKVVTGRE
jgi:hypothetical protein